MKQFFEVLLSVVIAMVLSLVAAQSVLTNTEISTAREYHSTVIERLENTGLSQKYIESIIDYTNNKTDYKLTIDPVDGTNDATSYHVSLKYPIKNAIYKLFKNNSDKNFAIVDGYASIGKNSPSLSDVTEEKHGKVTDNIELGNDVIAKVYEDGYLIVSGDGKTITENSDVLDNVRSTVTHIVFNGNVEEIPEEYFSNFTALKGITFGNKVKTIHRSAFVGCSDLETVLIPDNVVIVEHSVFADCSNLKYIYVNGSSKTTHIDEDVAYDSNNFIDVIYMKK